MSSKVFQDYKNLPKLTLLNDSLVLPTIIERRFTTKLNANKTKLHEFTANTINLDKLIGKSRTKYLVKFFLPMTSYCYRKS